MTAEKSEPTMDVVQKRFETPDEVKEFEKPHGSGPLCQIEILP